MKTDKGSTVNPTNIISCISNTHVDRILDHRDRLFFFSPIMFWSTYPALEVVSFESLQKVPLHTIKTSLRGGKWMEVSTNALTTLSYSTRSTVSIILSLHVNTILVPLNGYKVSKIISWSLNLISQTYHSVC